MAEKNYQALIYLMPVVSQLKVDAEDDGSHLQPFLKNHIIA